LFVLTKRVISEGERSDYNTHNHHSYWHEETHCGTFSSKFVFIINAIHYLNILLGITEQVLIQKILPNKSHILYQITL